MKVLVTGATGFVGRHVVAYLLKQGHEVVTTSRAPIEDGLSSWFEGVSHLPYSISRMPQQNLYELFGRPDKLIHLAWAGLPNYDAEHHIDENLPNSFQFIKNLIQFGLKDITVIGTCFEYGMALGEYNEEMLAKPANSYALAKDKLRIAIEELARTENFSFKWVRLFYLYGEGQAENSLIPLLLDAVKNGQSEFAMSPGDQKRDFLHIATAAMYISKIALQDRVEGVINCSSGHAQTVKSFVENYIRENRLNIKLKLGVYPYSKFEPFSFWGNTDKLNKALKDSS